jgi:hypothetical protein
MAHEILRVAGALGSADVVLAVATAARRDARSIYRKLTLT